MTLIKSISGIRGTIGGRSEEGLTPDNIVKFSAGFAQWIIETGRTKKVVVGRDGRISGEILKGLVINVLRSMGIAVTDVDLTTTPTIEMAVPQDNAGGGIMITASHNPEEWNALKLLDENGHFVREEASQKILDNADQQQYSFANVYHLGACLQNDSYGEFHINKILESSLVDEKAIENKNFKVVVDGINSTGGIFVPQLLRALGVENIIELNCEPHGKFAHSPEPLEENLTALTKEVREKNADVGFAVDPDVDRLAIVCEDGSFFGEEYTLVSVADYVLSHYKGPVVGNLSTTRALEKIAEKHEVPHYAAAVGEAHVADKMEEVQAVIGGEGNGGVIYPDLHLGRDAMAGIALFLSHMAQSGKRPSRLRSTYPKFHMVKDKVKLDENMDLENILNSVKDKYHKYPVNTVDGVKISFDDDWVHLRKSNTEPIIRIYAESTSETTAKNLSEKIIVDIRNLIKEKA